MTRAEAVVFVAAGVDALAAIGSDAPERTWTGEVPGDPCSGPRGDLAFEQWMQCRERDCEAGGGVWHWEIDRSGVCRDPGWSPPIDPVIQAGESITAEYGRTVAVEVPEGPDCTWWAWGEHDPPVFVLPGTGTRTVAGGGSFSLTQSDPDTNRDGINDDNLTEWTYHVDCGSGLLSGVVTFDEAE